jgi:hypothetical protein
MGMKNQPLLNDWVKKKKRVSTTRLVIFILIICAYIFTSPKHITRSIIVGCIFLVAYSIVFALVYLDKLKARKTEMKSVDGGHDFTYKVRLTAESLQLLNITLPDSSVAANRTISKFGIPGRLSVGDHKFCFLPDNAIRGIDYNEPINFDYDYFTDLRLVKLWNPPLSSFALGLSNTNGQVIEFILNDPRDLKARISKHLSIDSLV